MQKTDIIKGFFAITKKEIKQNKFLDFCFNDTSLCSNWTEVAFFLETLSGFVSNILEKEHSYNIGRTVKMKRAQKQKIHYLKIVISNNETIYLSKLECKLFTAVLNRVLARCDLLNSSSENIFFIGTDDE